MRLSRHQRLRDSASGSNPSQEAEACNVKTRSHAFYEPISDYHHLLPRVSEMQDIPTFGLHVPQPQEQRNGQELPPSGQPELQERIPTENSLRNQDMRGYNMREADPPKNGMLPEMQPTTPFDDFALKGNLAALKATDEIIATTKTATNNLNDVNNFRHLFDVPYQPWTMHKLITSIRENTHYFKSKSHQLMFKKHIKDNKFNHRELRKLILKWAPPIRTKSFGNTKNGFEVTIASDYIAKRLLKR
tara:strand:- start:2336 stop:3073 length:738 start_codon:yes stop_codon:yes gene_type:complete